MYKLLSNNAFGTYRMCTVTGRLPLMLCELFVNFQALDIFVCIA